jgi:hypothetical protein
MALQQMHDHGLLEPSRHSAAAWMAPAAITRRRMMSRAGAGALAMVPAIAAVMAPKAAQAYNGGVNGRNKSNDNDKPSAPKLARNADRKGDLGPDREQAQLSADALGRPRAKKEIEQ